MSALVDPSLIPRLIPQAPPMIMVDGLLEFSENNLVSSFTVAPDNLFCQNDRLSAPGLIEHMAQTIALYTGYQYYLRKEPAPTGYIGAIKSVEVIVLPRVGEQLRTTATVLHEIMGVTMVSVSSEINGRQIALSEMKTVLAP